MVRRLWIVGGLFLVVAGRAAWGIDLFAQPTMLPLYHVIPADDCPVVGLAAQADGTLIGLTDGRDQMVLFALPPLAKGAAKQGGIAEKVTVLDRLVVGDYAHPTLARTDDGTIYVGLRYAHPKAQPLPPAPPLYTYRPPDYARTEWPAPVENEGINALVADPARQRLYGLTTPGGHFFVTDLAARQTKDLGVVALAPDFYPDLLIASALALDADGNVYTSGAGPHPRTKQNTNGCLLRYGAATGELTRTASWLPAVPGRERFAAVEVFVRGPDGRLYGGTTDGYLFGLDPATLAVTNFGKPLRQAHVVGLACGPDGILYGVGGEPEGLARTFAYDLATHGFTLGPSPSGPMAGEVQSFGTIGAVALDGRGRLVCAERERKGYLVVFE